MTPELLFKHYTQEVDCYLSKTRRRRLPPDEKLMRSVEDAIDIPEQGADDFRRMFMAYVGQLYLKNKPITWDCHPTLKKAIKKLCGVNEERRRMVADFYLRPINP
jgi:predicted Ser/Thr protein kinase